MSSRLYSVAGLTLATSWPFTTPLSPAPAGTPDLVFEVVIAPPSGDDWIAASADDEGGYLRAGHTNGVEVVRVAGLGDALMPAPNRIIFHLRQDRHQHQVEVVFLGALLPDWLARHGYSSLHGSAVADEGTALAFLGANGAGKSTLAMGLSDIGWRVMSDDLVPVKMTDGLAQLWPTFPQMRLWPADAARILGSVEGLDRYHPDYDKLRVPLPSHQYCPEPRPLAAVYLPRRDPTCARPTFLRLAGAEALLQLMRNSSESHLTDPHRRRVWMERLAGLHAAVPVFRLTLPDDVNAARDSILAIVGHASDLQ